MRVITECLTKLFDPLGGGNRVHLAEDVFTVEMVAQSAR
jgi:hypothetical protein